MRQLSPCPFFLILISNSVKKGLHHTFPPGLVNNSCSRLLQFFCFCYLYPSGYPKTPSALLKHPPYKHPNSHLGEWPRFRAGHSLFSFHPNLIVGSNVIFVDFIISLCIQVCWSQQFYTGEDTCCYLQCGLMTSDLNLFLEGVPQPLHLKNESSL